MEERRSWGEKCVLKKGKDGENQEVLAPCVWESTRIRGAAGPWASAALAAGVLMLEGGFYIYIYTHIYIKIYI